MLGVRGEDRTQMSFAGDEEAVGAFGAGCAYPSFGERVGPWALRRGRDDGCAVADEDGVEGGGELAIPVTDQEPEPLGALAEVHQQVAGLVGHPVPGGMGGDPGEVHAAAVVFDHHEDVEAAQEHGVDVGEVDREDRMGLGGQELSPGRPAPSRRGIEARTLQDRPDVDAATVWPRPTSSP